MVASALFCLPVDAQSFDVHARQTNINSESVKRTVTMENGTAVAGLSVGSVSMPSKTSPAVIALRKINEALQQKVVSPHNGHDQSNGTSASTAISNEAVQQSTQRAEQLKSKLMEALQQDNLVEIRQTITEVEQAHLCKDALEISRIGAVVNSLRKSVAESNPELSRQCRQLIKSWRSNVTEASRPDSSCGSSTGGTPGLVSPAVRRGITPRAGKSATPNTVVNGIDGHSASNGYAPGSRVSPQNLVGQKRHAEVSPSQLQNAKKARVSPGQKVSPVSSVMAARQNVQSTEQLVASLGMKEILEKFTVKKAESPAVVPLKPMTPSQVQPTEVKTKRGRKPKSQQNNLPPAPLKLKIKFGGQPSSSSEENNSPAQSSSPVSSNNASPMPPKHMDSAPEPIPPTFNNSDEIVAEIKIKTTKISWYDQLVSVEELERRAEEAREKDAATAKFTKNTDPVILKHRQRELIIMPYVELDESEDLYANVFTL